MPLPQELPLHRGGCIYSRRGSQSRYTCPERGCPCTKEDATREGLPG